MIILQYFGLFSGQIRSHKVNDFLNCKPKTKGDVMRVTAYTRVVEIRHGTMSKHKYLVYKWTFQSFHIFVQNTIKTFPF